MPLLPKGQAVCGFVRQAHTLNPLGATSVSLLVVFGYVRLLYQIGPFANVASQACL